MKFQKITNILSISLLSILALSQINFSMAEEPPVTAPSTAKKLKTSKMKKTHVEIAAPVTTTTISHQEMKNEDHSQTSSQTHFAAGLQTVNNFGGSSSALSALIEINPQMMLQAFATVGGTSPVQFGVGGALKMTLKGNEKLGFHIGGLLGLGTFAGTSTVTVSGSSVSTSSGVSSKFFFELGGLAGVHFEVPGANQVMISFDGGPIYSNFDGTGNFTIQAVSNYLGLGVHYFFN